MSTIYLDPIQMDTTAGAVGEHAREILASADTVETACRADAPASLAGWLADELREIATSMRMVALLYTVAALDTGLRAQEIQADQSLVSATPSLVTTGATAVDAPAAGGGFVLGLPGTTSYVPLAGPQEGFVLGLPGTTSYVPLAGPQEGFMLGFGGPNVTLGGATGFFSGGSSLTDVVTRPNANIALTVASHGPVMIVDDHGTRGPMAGSFRSPETGKLELP